jgi:hypothetical protein
MSFDDYFGFEGCDDLTMAVRFLVGMSPRLPQRHYLTYPEIVDFVKHRVPSLGMACQFAAGMAVTDGDETAAEARRGQGAHRHVSVRRLPGALYRCWRPGGYRNPCRSWPSASSCPGSRSTEPDVVLNQMPNAANGHKKTAHRCAVFCASQPWNQATFLLRRGQTEADQAHAEEGEGGGFGNRTASVSTFVSMRAAIMMLCPKRSDHSSPFEKKK